MSTELTEYEPPASVASLRQRVSHLQGRVPEELIVSTHDEAQHATALLAHMAKVRKDAEADRVKEKRPILERGRQIDAAYKEVTAPLDGAEKVVKAGLLAYQREQRRLAAEQEQRRLEAARQAEADAAALATLADETALPPAVMPPPPAPVRTTITTGAGQAVGRKTWKLEVTDLRALCKAIADGDAPAHYVEAATTSLRAALMALPEDQRQGFAVPGVRFFQEEGLTVRS